ncbi:MAG: SRPBCC family protein [Acidobacteriota bacterium]
MAAHEYQFFTEWRVSAEPDLIFEILREGKDYPRWWPDVYLDSNFTPSGRSDHLGDRVELLTKGWLPYRLRWTAEVAHLVPSETIEITASGDFTGRGIWNLSRSATETVVTFDWRIRADKPFLRWFSPVFKPLFSWNHRWAMATGLPRLRAEVVRRTSVLAAHSTILTGRESPV